MGGKGSGPPRGFNTRKAKGMSKAGVKPAKPVKVLTPVPPPLLTGEPTLDPSLDPPLGGPEVVPPPPVFTPDTPALDPADAINALVSGDDNLSTEEKQEVLAGLFLIGANVSLAKVGKPGEYVSKDEARAFGKSCERVVTKWFKGITPEAALLGVTAIIVAPKVDWGKIFSRKKEEPDGSQGNASGAGSVVPQVRGAAGQAVSGRGESAPKGR